MTATPDAVQSLPPHPWARRPLLLGLLVAGVLAAWAPALLAQEGTDPPGDQEVVKPAPPTRHVLGNFIEVKVRDLNLVEFEGWMRDRARVEVYSLARSRYVRHEDTSENRALEGAGVRLYYVENLLGYTFLKWANIYRILEVRTVSEEEAIARQQELEAELARRREALRLLEEERKKKEQEAAEEAADEETAEEAAPKEEELSDSLKKGYRLLEDFPPPEWGEKKYKTLRYLFYVERVGIGVEERRFIEDYEDYWVPALEHRQKAQGKQ